MALVPFRQGGEKPHTQKKNHKAVLRVFSKLPQYAKEMYSNTALDMQETKEERIEIFYTFRNCFSPYVAERNLLTTGHCMSLDSLWDLIQNVLFPAIVTHALPKSRHLCSILDHYLLFEPF